MFIEASTIQPIRPGERANMDWDRLSGVLIPLPSSAPEAPAYPPAETVLNTEAIKSMLADIGVGISAANIALADALAKVGVPLTEVNLAEGQALLARMHGVSSDAFALAKALELPTSADAMKAISAVVDRAEVTNRLDPATLDILNLMPQTGNDSAHLGSVLSGLLSRLGQSTENKILSQSEHYSTIASTDPRSSLLDVARTPAGGQSALAANQYASFIEGQQLLNNASIQTHDNSAPLYFCFPIAFAAQETECEIMVRTSREKQAKDSRAADKEEYLVAKIRIESERLGTIETTLIGMWSGRLSCTLAAKKASTIRVLRRESSMLRKSLSALGWVVGSIEIARREHFSPLWLGGDLLDNPRSRVDQRI